MRRQRGAFLLALTLTLVVIATVVAATILLELTEARVKRGGTSQLGQFSVIEKAITAYVAAHKRLPCPADGSQGPTSTSRGEELRDGTGVCTSGTSAVADQKTGIVPWKTLGLKEQDALAADLTYISYRTFSGPNGLTVDNGADMTHCDRTDPSPSPTLQPSNQCATAHNNTSTQFLQDKGLTVVADSGPVTNVAYVLIHHGANGSGAYLQSGTRNPLPSATWELANVQGTNSGTYTATYYATSANTSVDVTSTSYFDDRVVYLTIEDLVRRAGLAARDWPDVVAGGAFDADKLAAAGFNVNSRSQTFSSATIGGITYTAPSGLVLTIDATGAPTGIGVGTPWGSRSLSGSDYVTMTLPDVSQKFSIILSRLGMKTSGGSVGYFEAATVELLDASDVLVASVRLIACNVSDDASTNVMLFDNVSAGVSFKKAILRPGIFGDPSVASAWDTNFYLNGMAICDPASSSCIPDGAHYTQTCPFTYTTP